MTDAAGGGMRGRWRNITRLKHLRQVRADQVAPLVQGVRLALDRSMLFVLEPAKYPETIIN